LQIERLGQIPRILAIYLFLFIFIFRFRFSFYT